MTPEKLLEEYEKLVQQVVFKIVPQSCRSRLIDDCLQEGRMALLYAWERFDDSRGTKFKSYASQVIKTKVRDFLAENRYNVNFSPSAYRRIQKHFYEKYNYIDHEYTERQQENIDEILTFVDMKNINEEDWD